MPGSKADKRGTPPHESKMGRAERDLVALGIAVAAILLFVGTGGLVLPQVVRSWTGVGAAPNPVLVNAPEAVALAADVARDLVGPEAVDVNYPPSMGSEPQSPLGQAKRYWKRSALDMALPAIP